MLFAASALVASVVPTKLLAQTAPSTAASANSATSLPSPTEQIVVTGSRLKHSDVTSEAPVTIVSAVDIKRSGAQTVEDILKNLPAIGTSGIYSTTNNGGDGASCTDIHNLQPDRTLVLVNSKRFVQTGASTFSCVDLNNIPVALIDRVEILKDGASAVYGADAVAGVVNIILKQNFTGTTVNLNGGLATRGGDRTGEANFATGGTFDKGSFTVSGGYYNQGEITQSSRDWSHYVISDNIVRPYLRIGSGIPLGGRIFDSPNVDPNTALGLNLLALGNGQTKNFSNLTDRFNWGDRTWLNGKLEKYNLAATVNYEIAENINFYAQGFYTHSRTQQQLAPYPLTQGAPGTPFSNDLIVPAGNPFLTQLGINEDVLVYKRLNEFGNRQYIQNTNTFQGAVGLNGALAYGWDYDVFFNYGRSDKNLVETNLVNFPRLEQQLGFVQTFDPNAAVPADAGYFDGFASCTRAAQAGCVPANLFGPNGISQAAVMYSRFNNTESTAFTLRQFGGNIKNDAVIDLPFGPLGLDFGIEQRSEHGEYHPDNLVLAGYSGNPPVPPTNGGFDVFEAYGEANVPLLKDLPFAKDLHVNLSGRYFDYNTFGSGETWQVGMNYTPFTGIRFRGTLGENFRQPSINDLYGGQSVSYNTATDPCTNVAAYGSASGTVAANCAAQGVPANLQGVNGQVKTFQGGSPTLQPETARTYTAGTVIQPPFVPGLAITADYFHTKIENSIASVDTQTILDTCYTSPGLSSPLCKQIAPRDGVFQLSTVNSTLHNLGVTQTDGLDIGLNYVLQMNQYGTLAFNNELALVFSWDQQNVPNGPFINYNGKIIAAAPGNYAYPRKRDNFSVSWTFGNVNLGYRMRYISGMDIFRALPDGIAVRTNEVFYHDINATYTWRNIDATFGIDNMFDRAPPLVVDGETNTNPSAFDVVGRFVYLKTAFKF